MTARSHGNGTNFDWLRKACDGNPEKYGRPMPVGVVPCYRSYLLVWCLTVGHACLGGTSL